MPGVRTIYSREYDAWVHARHRCYKPWHPQYKDYGARGIKMCARWDKFLNFLEDMGRVPEGMTLERKDNNGDYSPENCVWATQKAQTRNRRSNVNFTLSGETLCMSAWAERLGITVQAIHRRINVLGWSIDRSLTQRRTHNVNS